MATDTGVAGVEVAGMVHDNSGFMDCSGESEATINYANGGAGDETNIG